MWKVVDVDNFMRGNSMFRKYEPEEEEIDPIFEGTVFDRSTHADVRKFWEFIRENDRFYMVAILFDFSYDQTSHMF